MAARKRKTDRQVWDELQADAELDRIKHLTTAELEAEVRADGGDPVAIRQRGAALAAKVLPERAVDWKSRAKARLDELKKRVGEWPSFAGLSRNELLARLRAAQADPGLSGPVALAFRKRSAEDATDEELREILEEIAVLRKLAEKDGG